LANQILIGMILGALLGFAVGPRVSVIAPIGTVFLRLLKMTILPLIFFSIVAGIASVADLKRLRKVGAIFLGYWQLHHF
jgi:Na+/H+-dicarboxylate symporter